MYDYTNGTPLLHVQPEKQVVPHLFTIKKSVDKKKYKRANGYSGR